MIARLIHWWCRTVLQAAIDGHHRDLEQIARQRENDDLARREIERMLCVAKRRLQCEIQREVNEATRSNVRRVDHERRQQEIGGAKGK